MTDTDTAIEELRVQQATDEQAATAAAHKAMLADPEGYWAGIAESGLEMTIAHCKGLAGQLQSMLFELLELTAVQSREIALFRAMETRAKAGTLTKEIMKDLLDKLTALREDTQAKAMARMAIASQSSTSSTPAKTNGVDPNV